MACRDTLSKVIAGTADSVNLHPIVYTTQVGSTTTFWTSTGIHALVLHSLASLEIGSSVLQTSTAYALEDGSAKYPAYTA